MAFGHFKLGAAALALAVTGSAVAAPPAATYVKMAAASDMYEIRSSKLVLSTTQNAGLKTFAQQMVTDHTKSTADIKAAAMSSGLKPGMPQLPPKKMADISALTAAKGTARDALYIRQQKAAHAEALALHKDYAGTGDKAPLKAVAAQIVPVVEHHATMINAM